MRKYTAKQFKLKPHPCLSFTSSYPDSDEIIWPDIRKIRSHGRASPTPSLTVRHGNVTISTFNRRARLAMAIRLCHILSHSLKYQHKILNFSFKL